MFPGLLAKLFCQSTIETGKNINVLSFKAVFSLGA